MFGNYCDFGNYGLQTKSPGKWLPRYLQGLKNCICNPPGSVAQGLIGKFVLMGILKANLFHSFAPKDKLLNHLIAFFF